MSDPFGWDECSPERPCLVCQAHRRPPATDPREARIAELERELARLREFEALTYRGQRDAALAEVARLEALIVATVERATGIDADLHAEADRIRSRS